jgi:hypothetical protein
MTREAGFKCMFTFIQFECVHDAICYAHGAAASPITEEAANEYLMLDERRQSRALGEYQSRPVQLETLTSFPVYTYERISISLSVAHTRAPLQPARKLTPKLIDLIAEAMTHLGVKSVLRFKISRW